MKRFFSLALLALIAIPFVVNAQVGLRPEMGDKRTFDMKAGETVTRYLNVINFQDEPIDVTLYATDGTLTDKGTFTVLTKNAPQSFIGKWVTFTPNKLHLEPKEEKKISYQVTVPIDTTPGDYGGGISLEPYVVRDDLTATGAVVSTRVVHTIYVSVAGQKITDYKWNSFVHDVENKHLFKLNFNNNGNTLIKAGIKVTITDSFGNKTNLPVSDMSLAQKTNATSEAQWNDSPMFGFFTANADVTFYELDARNQSFKEISKETKTVSFSIIPWKIVIAIASVLALLAAVFAMKALQFRNFVRKCKEYAVKDGDTLGAIAKDHGTSWEMLAKINKLKAPYSISKGQKILVPTKK